MMRASRATFSPQDWAGALGAALVLHLLMAWWLLAGRPPVSSQPAGPSGALAVASLAWRGTPSPAVPALTEAPPVAAGATLAEPVRPPEPRVMTEVIPSEQSRSVRQGPTPPAEAPPPPAREVARTATVGQAQPAQTADDSERPGVRKGSPAEGRADGQDRAAEPMPGNPRGHEGRVLLRVAVLGNGRVGRVDLARSSGHGSLDRAALAAVKRWRFRPALRGGEAVAATLTVPVVFRLEDSG